MGEVERNIRSMSDTDLIEMVRVDFKEYTDGALFFARDELSKRGILEEDSILYTNEESPESSNPEDHGSVESVEAFLAGELKYPESYDAILDFVTSMNIRSGEYEGAGTVIKKMDRENFILYSEVVKESGRDIQGCTAVSKGRLVEGIEKIGLANGFVEEEEEAEV